MSQVIEMPKTARPVTPLGILVEKLEETVQMAEQAKVSPFLMASLQQAFALAAGIDPYLEE